MRCDVIIAQLLYIAKYETFMDCETIKERSHLRYHILKPFDRESPSLAQRSLLSTEDQSLYRMEPNKTL